MDISQSSLNNLEVTPVTSEQQTKKQKRMAKQRVHVTLQSFELLNVIGEGKFGTVLLVKKKDSGKLFAMKIIKKSIIRKRQFAHRIIQEKDILAFCNNNFITKLHYSFQNQNNLFLILDYCSGGDLFNYISKKNTFSEKDAKFYAAQIVLMLEYLHSQNIVYRDLKPENILIEKNGYLKLGDFGYARQNMDSIEAKSVCGTPHYFPPEMITREGHGKPVDWWALGCVIYEMVFGATPYDDSNQKILFDRIKNSPVIFENDKNKKVSNNFKDIVNKLLKKNQNERLGTASVEEIKNHPWFDKIDWVALSNQTIPAPFIPAVKKVSDVSNFDATFTNKDVSDYNNDSTDCSSDDDSDEYQNFYYDCSQKQL
ncbi:hypothetical protein ABPG72_018851 [Tetrahymena utriculariae]